MHLNCCDWAGVIGFTIQILSNFFVYFSPCICSDRRNLGWSRKTLLVFQAEQGYTQWNIPHEGVLCTCCCPPRLSSPLLDRVQGLCSQPLGAGKQKVRKHRRECEMCDFYYICLLTLFCKKQSTSFVLWGGLVIVLKEFSPPFSCFMLIGLWPVPWECRKILHIFFLITAPVVTLSPGLSELVATRTPSKWPGSTCEQCFLDCWARALAPVVSTLFCTGNRDCCSGEY